MGERIGLLDEEWELIGTLLPAEHGWGCRPAHDNRRFFEGMLETLASVVERDASADMIDSTIIRAHHCAAGIEMGLSRQKDSAGRAVGSPPSSTPGAMPGAAHSLSF